MSLEEALAKGRVKVSETGSVNALTVENVGVERSTPFALLLFASGVYCLWF